jgi:arylformamidase
LYPATDPKAPCFVHIHGGYWQRGSKEIFACLAEGPLANGWSAALPGYTIAPEASLTQITNELRSAFDWLDAKAAEHGIAGAIIVTGWSAGGHLTAFILDHPKVAAGLSISGVFELAPLRDSPQVNDKLKLTEVEVETLSPMRRPSVNKALAIAYGTGELPAMIASSRDYHAYRSQKHLPGDLIPIANTNHFTKPARSCRWRDTRSRSEPDDARVSSPKLERRIGVHPLLVKAYAMYLLIRRMI